MDPIMARWWHRNVYRPLNELYLGIVNDRRWQRYVVIWRRYRRNLCLLMAAIAFVVTMVSLGDHPICMNPDKVRVTVEWAKERAKKESIDRQSGTEWSIVTGAAGLIGYHVAAHCLAIGQNVVLIDDSSGGFTDNLPSKMKALRRVEFERGSITDDLFLDRVFTK